MKKFQKLSGSLKMDISDLWDDSDLTVNEETSNNMPRQSLNKTRQFKNTMKNNKGKVKSEDLSDYVLDKDLHQHSSSFSMQIDCFVKELKINCDQEQSSKKLSKSSTINANTHKTACTACEGAKILSTLRRISSDKLLKVIL
ncbi:unnamed protein product [Moneuplotes crassus]|uniref:Uncharacterized protein n=2 Tax=Euplotes crassus TaxID=5936 RepID=A0AAD1USA9_EUPCR|nr:unnamed protein product [Moneuplotes crassus]